MNNLFLQEFDYLTLLRYPKLIDCAIKSRQNTKNDWFITSDNKYYHVPNNI